MAIVIRGKSVCHVCGRVLAVGDDVELFPSGLFNPRARTAHLNDSGIHAACFEALPEHDEAAEVLDEYLRRFDEGHHPASRSSEESC